MYNCGIKTHILTHISNHPWGKTSHYYPWARIHYFSSINKGKPPFGKGIDLSSIFASCYTAKNYIQKLNYCIPKIHI